MTSVLDRLARRPAGMHVVITGRAAPTALIDAADLVTELQNRALSAHKAYVTEKAAHAQREASRTFGASNPATYNVVAASEGRGGWSTAAPTDDPWAVA